MAVSCVKFFLSQKYCSQTTFLIIDLMISIAQESFFHVYLLAFFWYTSFNSKISRGLFLLDLENAALLFALMSLYSKDMLVSNFCLITFICYLFTSFMSISYKLYCYFFTSKFSQFTKNSICSHVSLLFVVSLLFSFVLFYFFIKFKRTSVISYC